MIQDPRFEIHSSSSTFHDSRSTIRGRRGMTLIELLVVIAIMAVLTGVMVGYSKQSRNQILLNTEKAKVAQIIQRVKSLTLSGYTKPVSLPPPCAYGFAIDYAKNEYFIFQYSPNDCSSLSAITNLTVNANPPFKKTESFILSDGVNFKKENDSLEYLVFIPPNLTSLIFWDENNKSGEPLTIHLETSDQSLAREIVVNPNGQLSL